MVIKKRSQLTKDGTVNFILLEIELNKYHSPTFAKEMISERYRQRHNLTLKYKIWQKNLDTEKERKQVKFMKK